MRVLIDHQDRLYVDGFNLYYRAVRGTPFKWLDLRKLGEALFPRMVRAALAGRIGGQFAPLFSCVDDA